DLAIFGTMMLSGLSRRRAPAGSTTRPCGSKRRPASSITLAELSKRRKRKPRSSVTPPSRKAADRIGWPGEGTEQKPTPRIQQDRKQLDARPRSPKATRNSRRGEARRKA